MQAHNSVVKLSRLVFGRGGLLDYSGRLPANVASAVINSRAAATPLISRCVSTSAARHFWNKDWKPGAYPKTEVERLLAAKKYGLQPEDYEPYPEDAGYGDYPNFTPISVDSRDPNEHYDYPQHKRNFGEPIHIEMDGYDQFRYDIYLFNPKNPNRYPRTILWTYWFWARIIAVVAVLGYLGESFKFHYPMMPKQYPYNDLWWERGEDMRLMPDIRHYTFEPADEPAEE